MKVNLLIKLKSYNEILDTFEYKLFDNDKIDYDPIIRVRQ